jgi:hypothetical protein
MSHKPLSCIGSLRDKPASIFSLLSCLRRKREDGSAAQQPSLRGKVTYTADGHFHFITVRTDAPKYA